MKISATKKGMITGCIMIIISLIIFHFFKNFDNSFQYIAYFVYVAGIVWSLYDFTKTDEFNGKFGPLFSQGFKCFVVVTLLMVLFTFIFIRFHPELKDQMAVAYKTELIRQGNYTPAEMDTMILKSKGNFATMLVSMAIFGYLIIGALVTAISSALLMKKK